MKIKSTHKMVRSISIGFISVFSILVAAIMAGYVGYFLYILLIFFLGGFEIAHA